MSDNNPNDNNPLLLALREVFGPLVKLTSRLPAPLAYGGAVALALLVVALLGAVIPGELVWLLGIIVLASLAAFVFLVWDSRRPNPKAGEKPRRSDPAGDKGVSTVHIVVHAAGDKTAYIHDAEVRISFPRTFTDHTDRKGDVTVENIPASYRGKSYPINASKEGYRPRPPLDLTITGEDSQPFYIDLEPLTSPEPVPPAAARPSAPLPSIAAPAGRGDPPRPSRPAPGFARDDPQKLPKPPLKEKPLGLANLTHTGLRTLKVTGIIDQKPHSIIENCLIENQPYVLKRTDRNLCDADALLSLLNSGPVTIDLDSFNRPSGGNRMKARLKPFKLVAAKPEALWVTDDSVWEIYPFYDGIPLPKIITLNKYHIAGSFLAELHNALFTVTEGLHRLGVLHRDINPTNLMWCQDRLVLMDPSFACMVDHPQAPTGNKQYAPPEQLLGHATVESDWFSAAATIYYLAYGAPPPLDDPEQLSAGIQEMNFGGYGSSFYRRNNELYSTLLDLDPHQRPDNPRKLYLNPSSVPVFFYPVLGVLDLDQFGYLVIQSYDSRYLNPDETRQFIQEALKADAVYDPDLQRDCEAFLKGERPWIQ